MKRRPFSASALRRSPAAKGALAFVSLALLAFLTPGVAFADDTPAPPAGRLPDAPEAPAAPPKVPAPAAPSAPSAEPPPSVAPPPAASPPPVSPSLAVAPPPAAAAAPTPPAPAAAAPEDDSAPERRVVTHLYRKGFMLSLVLGPALGQGSGYPNDVQKVGNPTFFSRSPVMPGSSFQAVIGGALTDYFTFGFMFGGGAFRSDEWQVSATAVGFRVEAFPGVLAFPKSKALANIGLGGDFGAGMINVQAVGNYPGVTGFQTMLGASVFYDFKLFNLLGGHVSVAPELAYHAAYHTSSQVNFGSLTARLTFYGGP